MDIRKYIFLHWKVYFPLLESIFSTYGKFVFHQRKINHVMGRSKSPYMGGF